MRHLWVFQQGFDMINPERWRNISLSILPFYILHNKIYTSPTSPPSSPLTSRTQLSAAHPKTHEWFSDTCTWKVFLPRFYENKTKLAKCEENSVSKNWVTAKARRSSRNYFSLSQSVLCKIRQHNWLLWTENLNHRVENNFTEKKSKFGVEIVNKLLCIKTTVNWMCEGKWFTSVALSVRKHNKR